MTCAIALIRGLPRLLVDHEGLRLIEVLGTTARRWRELGPFAPDDDGVVSTWYSAAGARIFKIAYTGDAIRLAEALNTWRERSLSAR